MIPAELLAIAQATRATFGAQVTLKHWDDGCGHSQGNTAYDALWLLPRDGQAQSQPISRENSP